MTPLANFEFVGHLSDMSDTALRIPRILVTRCESAVKPKVFLPHSIGYLYIFVFMTRAARAAPMSDKSDKCPTYRGNRLTQTTRARLKPSRSRSALLPVLRKVTR